MTVTVFCFCWSVKVFCCWGESLKWMAAVRWTSTMLIDYFTADRLISFNQYRLVQPWSDCLEIMRFQHACGYLQRRDFACERGKEQWLAFPFKHLKITLDLTDRFLFFFSLVLSHLIALYTMQLTITGKWCILAVVQLKSVKCCINCKDHH